MTTPPPVLLVLAWDDADPAVHRVEATGHLPTLSLVRALAAGQPVLALLPQLPPAGGDDTPTLGPNSRLVGLSNFTPATLAAGLGGLGPAAQETNSTAPPLPPTAGAAGPSVQLRPPLAQRAGGRQMPAAPYVGRAETPAQGLSPALGSSGSQAAEPIAATEPGAPAIAPDLPPPITAPAPNVPAAAITPEPAPPFDQPLDDIGSAEAADLAADPDPLPPAPVGPVQATLTQGLAALHRPAATAATEAAAPAFSLSDDLHYRVIQYARFATYLSDTDAEDVGVIYAPDWPTWLAALEIRYRRRRPLVLHLGLLAAESAAPAERGWLLELERYAVRRAHTVLVVSNDLRAQVLKHYGLAPNRVRVVAADDNDGVRAVLAEIGGLKNVGNAGDVKM